MKNVVILGASGDIAKHVIDMLATKNDIQLTLFLRNRNKLKIKEAVKCRIIEGDILNYNQLKKAISGQDIVYVNLAGDLESMAKNIVKAMQEAGVSKLVPVDFRSLN